MDAHGIRVHARSAFRPGQAEPVQPSAGLVEQVREEPRMVGKVLVLRPGAQGGRGGTVRGRGDVGDEGLDVGQVAVWYPVMLIPPS